MEASRISRRALGGFGEVSALNSSLLHPSRTANSYTVVAQDTCGRSATNLVARAWNGTAVPSYDANGNLRSDGARWFDYGLEDQLVSVYSPGEWRVDYAYDAWRRVRIKRESTWSGAWSQTNEVRYVYDGRLVLQERDGSNRPVATYTRGPDLSGSLDGAGGIGGLLSMRRGTQDTAYFADAGGNVTALVNANQQVVGRYLYDAYGDLIGMSGPMSEVNRYRFSSKEVDPTSGLYSFGYRIYAAEFQRWLNRDPIEENGGINLFGYVGNDPVANVYPYGLVSWGDFNPLLILDPEAWGNLIHSGAVGNGGRGFDPNSNMGLRNQMGMGVDDFDGLSGSHVASMVGGAVVAGTLSAVVEGLGSTGKVHQCSKWGWPRGKKWRDAVKQVQKAGTHESIAGHVPTRDEALRFLKEAGVDLTSKEVREEMGHLRPNPHTYPHINYPTPGEGIGTIRIQ